MRMFLFMCLMGYCPLVKAQNDLPKRTSDSSISPNVVLSSRFLRRVEEQSNSFNNAVDRHTTRYLQRLAAEDARIVQSLQTIDPNAGAHLAPAAYSQFEGRLQSAAGVSKTYLGRLDSLSTTVKYLGRAQAGSTISGVPVEKLTQLGEGLKKVQANIDRSTVIEQYVQSRQEQIRQYFNSVSGLPANLSQAFNRYKTTAYYYRQQMADLKASFNDSKRIEQRLYTQLAKSPSYQSFLAKHSMLAALFALPSGYADSNALAGLQTKDMVERQIQQVGGKGVNAVIGAQLQDASQQLSRMRNNVAKYGSSGQNLDMPDFQPNSQATKSLFGRLTYGVNLQVTGSGNYLPATGIVGAQLGYKLDDKKTLGLGIAYNLGIGQDIGHLHFSSQGIGLRSYGEVRIKQGWYAAGGYELNYLSAFGHLAQLKNYNAWQPSALIGIEKKYRISGKMQGSLQLLFDALYRQTVPVGQAIKFRTGYSFR